MRGLYPKTKHQGEIWEQQATGSVFKAVSKAGGWRPETSLLGNSGSLAVWCEGRTCFRLSIHGTKSSFP